MPWLLGASALWFCGFALLVSIAPLWVIHGGGGNLGAGLVTAVMMACTVLAQLSMRRVLAGLGWRRTLMLGSGLLGLPALGHLATDALWPVTALAALRGLGFGIVTVCGATAVAALVEPARRGRAIGAYGLALAAPQFVLVPIAPWLVGRAGFGLVFVLAVVPALAIPLAWPIARAMQDRPTPQAGTGDDASATRRTGLWRVLAGPIAALVVITASGGAILTFAPHFLPGSALGFGGLLAFTGAAAVARWRAGGIADRLGPTVAIAPMLFTGAIGLAAIGLTADGIGTPGRRVLVLCGLLLTGVAYGGLQNLTLTQAFLAAGEPARSSVSIAWNLSFDAGTGIGAFAVGAIATVASYSAAFIVLAVAAGLVGSWWLLRPLSGARRTDGRTGIPRPAGGARQPRSPGRSRPRDGSYGRSRRSRQARW
jgi:hypothetical protein